MFDLTGKTALVTGASGGIGGAIAQALHAAGATVALSGTRTAPLEALAADLHSFVAGRRLDDPMVRRMIGLGMRLGTTYQAVDDVRDGDGDGRAAAVQFAALERRLATLPDLPRVRMLIDRFRSAAAAARAIRPVA